MAKFEHEQIRYGQTHRYGDTECVYAIRTDCTDEAEVMKYCDDVINEGKHYPTRYERASSYSSYCELSKTDYGWQYTIIYPYDD